MRLKRKNPGPTMNLKDGRREQAVARAMEAKEGGRGGHQLPPREEGEKDEYSSKEEAG